MQRNKGATYEREVAARFSEALGKPFHRNLSQTRDGGKDLQVGPLVVECKRRKNLGLFTGWLAQARRACDPKAAPERDVPIVVMRADGGDSMVLCSLDDFLSLAEPEISRRIWKQQHQHVLPTIAELVGEVR